MTVMVLCVVTATIALANLSFDESSTGDWHGYLRRRICYRSYGWPIIWHRLVLHFFPSGMSGSYHIVGWYYSAPRLTANIVLWPILLTVSSGACEWLVRRYLPQPRWSMRTLLIFVAVVAGLCAWYAKVRNRAILQDEIIASSQPPVVVERWGPKWLDLLGMDRFRRRIVSAELYIDYSDEGELLQLARLPELRSLALTADELTPGAAKTLGGMRQLHALDIELGRLTPSVPAALDGLRELHRLSIALGLDGYDLQGSQPMTAGDDEARLADECLAAIAQMTRLEALSLTLPLRGESLARLSHIKGLKSLQLDFWTSDWYGSEHHKPDAEGCLRAVGTLMQLEWLSVQGLGFSQSLRVTNESLGDLAGLTELKTLSLGLATDDRPMLSCLPALPRLERLDLSSSDIDDDDLRRLSVLPSLKSLRLGQEVGTPLFTRNGLADLASARSLEEVRLDGLSPQKLLALLAVKRLKRLHLGRNTHGSVGSEGNLTLDDGVQIRVYDLEGFQDALAALRKSDPGLVINADEMPIFRRTPARETPVFGIDEYDADPDRPSSWVPGGDVDWMTPQELADFETEGGLASFYGATWRQSARLVTVEFDAPRRGK